LHLKKGINKNTNSIKIQSRIKNIISGEYLWHEVSLTPFKNENDELDSWIGYIVDIHKQKIFEETLKDNVELKQTQSELKVQQVAMEKVIEELNRSNQELQQFAFIASHDLQEPVRKLLFYSDSLLGKYAPSFDGKDVEYLTIMHASALRMRILIHDLLTFSQINKSEINYQQIDLNELANTVKLDLEMLVTEKKAQIHISRLPSVDGDERMIRQLFTNIINNALKYSKAGVSPIIHITNKITGDYCELSFRDNGIGFEEQYLPQIFTLFQRLHSREIYEGTGLGLAICRKIIELHNGKIWAESKPSEGATFFIHLPISKN
jgi:light-regulated signal transduction histidine kinase (bacteriophytochrome)